MTSAPDVLGGRLVSLLDDGNIVSPTQSDPDLLVADLFVYWMMVTSCRPHSRIQICWWQTCLFIG